MTSRFIGYAEEMKDKRFWWIMRICHIKGIPGCHPTSPGNRVMSRQNQHGKMQSTSKKLTYKTTI